MDGEIKHRSIMCVCAECVCKVHTEQQDGKKMCVCGALCVCGVWVLMCMCVCVCTFACEFAWMARDARIGGKTKVILTE